MGEVDHAGVLLLSEVHQEIGLSALRDQLPQLYQLFHALLEPVAHHSLGTDAGADPNTSLDTDA